MSLEALTKNLRRTQVGGEEIQAWDAGDRTVIVPRSAIEAAAQHVVEFEPGVEGAILAWECDGHIVRAYLFDWAFGDKSSDGGGHYSMIADVWGCVAFGRDDEPTSELRTLCIGNELPPCAPGYLDYPDIAMLQWFLAKLTEVFARAQREKFGGPNDE